MSYKNLSYSHGLFSFANLLAAFGGGMILGKGMGVIANAFLQGGTSLAFLMGTVLGLLFLMLMPKNLSKTMPKFFAFFCSFSSMILLWLFINYSSNETISGEPALFFFCFLTIRFGFWFYSRVARAAEAAGQKQKIAWVELGYFSGIISGLIVWEIFGIKISFITALIIDSCLQFFVGLIDLLATFKFKLSSVESTITTEIKKVFNETSKSWYWRMTSSLIFLTIGIQVIIFNISYHASKHFGSYVLAFFYIGVAMAAIFCSHLKVRLEWHPFKNKKLSRAIICHNSIKNGMSFFFVSVLAIVCVLFATFGAMLGLNENLILIFVALSAFLYEILALAIIDRIGLETNLINKQLVMRSYGFMGIGAAVSLWFIGMIDNSLINLFVMITVSLMFSALLIQNRDSSIANSG